MVQSAKAGSGSPRPVGNGERLVGEGECAISIADAAGHFWKTIWDHADNAEVKRARGSPHVLMSGDRLHVPAIRLGEESVATEQRHRFRRKGIPINFEMVVKEDGKALAGVRYVLTIEGRSTNGTIPGDGLVKAPMMPADRTGVLRVFVGGQVRAYPLEFGRLDPPQTRAGAEGRLRNLGYIGPATDEGAFEAALRRFQQEQGVSESGELDEVTAGKLAEVHGS